MALMTASCQTTDFKGTLGDARKPTVQVSQQVPHRLVNSEPRRITLAGLQALEANDLDAASAKFNQALKMDIRNSYLQFINSLTYHLRALDGNAQDFELARTGYALAQQFDPNNWLAAFYEGLLHKDLREFEKAQASFARAYLLERGNPDILFELAQASYYAQDLKTALGALRSLEKADLPLVQRRRLADLSAIVHAGANMPNAATRYLRNFEKQTKDARRVAYLRRRLAAWRDFHVRRTGSAPKSAFQLAQFVVPEGEGEPIEAVPVPKVEEKSLEAPTNAEPTQEQGKEEQTTETDSNPWFGPKSEPAKKEPAGAADAPLPEQEPTEAPNPMVVVDVVILRTEDDNTTSRGINLLSGLKIQFGDPLAGTAGLSFSRQKTDDRVDPDDSVNTRTVTRLISLPAVSYSLNIANAAQARNEILARPTLVAMSGETSEFFSGVQVAAAAVSSGQGDSVSIDKEIGVKLAVTPEILENGFVRLDVEAERTFLTQPSSSVVFNFRLDTTKTSLNSAVTLRFGQTLILGGLSEREKEGNRDGVPFLQEIPGVQYLFSQKTTRDFNKSVLILITPRRAQALDQTPEEFQKNLSRLTAKERDIEQLSYEFRDWFKPTPNVNGIFQHMQENTLYREFKNGDFPLASWQSQQGHLDRLITALEFLYY